MSDFNGKTVVVSGGAEGIGLSVGRALGREGMNVVLADIDVARLQQAEAELSGEGITVLTLALDVADEIQWQRVAEQTLARFGKIHMLVNNAGVGGHIGDIESFEETGWRWTLDVNLMGVLYGAKTIVPLIKKHGEGGWLLNVASMAGMAGVPFGGAYTATKAAVVALSESWSAELKPHNIHVAVLCPAFVKTRIHESQRNRQQRYVAEKEPAPHLVKASAFAKKGVEQGIDVDLVGRRVVEALGMKELYIFTHPNYRSVTQLRAKEIDEAFERATQSALLQHIVDQEIYPV